MSERIIQRLISRSEEHTSELSHLVLKFRRSLRGEQGELLVMFRREQKQKRQN